MTRAEEDHEKSHAAGKEQNQAEKDAGHASCNFERAA